MTLIFFKYGLPVLLGYTLFVGISGRLNPFARPYYHEERASQILGIWTGLSISLVLAFTLHLAYGMPLYAAKVLLQPAASLLATLLVPAIALYVYYLYRSSRTETQAEQSSVNWAITEGDLDEKNEFNHDPLSTHTLDIALKQKSALNETSVIDELDALDETSVIDELDALDETSAIDDTSALDETSALNETSAIDDTGALDETSALSETSAIDEISVIDETSALDEPIAVPVTHADDKLMEVSPAYLDTVKVDRMAIAAGTEAVNDSDKDNEELEGLSTDLDGQIEPCTPCSTDVGALSDNQEIDYELSKKLHAEVTLREEIEAHLRITRKALSVMESETRHHSTDKADAIIELEEKLALSIEKSADLETDIMRESALRSDFEQSVIDLKHKLVKARQEIRRSAAARASALSTANKSIAFARQSVQVRTRLEQELLEAQTTIDNRQKTISSLIRALEKEKRKTQSEVNSMAKQLVLHDRQLKARRTLEEVARSVENKLTSRLVKKVAKARPLASDMNQGEAN